MRVVNMGVVNFREFYAFVSTITKNIEIIDIDGMRVLSNICVFGYAFLFG